MPSDDEWARALARIDELERIVSSLTAPQGNSTLLRSLLNGTPRIPYGTAFTGPNGTRYYLHRAAGGAAAFLALPVPNPATWSDA